MSFYPLKNKSFKVLTASALFVILGIYFTAGLVWAAPNLQINYQGKLTNASNIAVADAGYQMEFSLYTSDVGGTAIWTETRTGVNEVTVENGLFSVMLGSVNPLTGVDFNQTLYLGVTVEADSEMTPRKILGAVPAAFEARNANTVGGVASTSLLRNDRVGSISTTSASTLFTVTQSGTGDILNLFDGGTEVFSVLDGGNVGIGSTSPSSKLSVSGNTFIGGNLTATGTLVISGTSTLATTTANNLTLTQALAGTSGGTGFNTYATGDFLYASGVNTLAKRTIGSTGNIISVVGGVPTWIATSTLAIALADTTGTLAGNRGGTGLSTVTQNQLLIGGAGNTWSQVATSSLGLSSSFTTSAQLAALLSDETGTGTVVFSNSPVFTTPNLGTPSALVGTNITGTASGLTAGNVTTNANLTGAITSVGNTASLGSFTSASLLGALTDETGTGFNVFSISPTFTGTANFANTANTGTLAISGTSTFATTTISSSTITTLTLNNALALTSGGTGATTASGARTNLGATTVGANIFTLTNPGALSFIRINADNTISAVATSTLGIALADTTGTLAGNRGGTGLSTVTQNQLLIGGAGNTWSQVATSSLGLSSSFTTSAQLAALLSDETGTGLAVFNNAPTISGLPTFSGLTANRLMVVGASGISTTTITLANVINTISDVSGSTGTGNLALSASPTFTGTVTGAAATLSGNLTLDGQTSGSNVGLTLSSQGTPSYVLRADSFDGFSDNVRFRQSGTGLQNIWWIWSNGDSVTEYIAINPTSERIRGANQLVFQVGSTSVLTLATTTSTMTTNLSFSGSSANIALGFNYLSGDGGDEGIFVDGSGNVGVGTSTPGQKLSVIGNINIAGTSPALMVNNQTLLYASTTFPTSLLALGLEAGNIVAGGIEGVDHVTAIGYRALASNLTVEVTAVGARALENNIYGSGNVAVGDFALNKNVDGSFNTAVGSGAISGESDYNTALGYYALGNTFSSQENVAIGMESLRFNRAGSYNTMVGSRTGTFLSPATSTGANTFIGYNTGRGITTGTGNTILGANISGLSATLSNTIIIADGTGNQRINVDSSGNMGIGTTTPSSLFTVGATFGSQLLVTSAGLITDGTWNADTIGATYGGTAQTTYATGDMLYASGANTLAKRTVGSTGDVLSVVGGVPSWVATSTLGISGGASTFLSLTDTPFSFSANRIMYTNAGATALVDSPNFTFDGTDLGLGVSNGVAIGGTRILYASSTNYSTLVGDSAGSLLNATGISNTAVGYQTLSTATSSTNSTAVGYQALKFDTTGYNNTALGAYSLRANTIGQDNAAFGTYSLFNNTTGIRNLAIGTQSLLTNVSGDNNVAIGFQTLFYSTSSDNVGIGSYSLYNNLGGSSNIGIGSYSLFASANSNNNTAIGAYTGFDLVGTGNGNNTLIGYNTGRGITTGTGNTILGANISGLSATLSNTIIIADGTGNQRINVDSSGNMGIGTTTPSSLFTVGATFGSQLLVTSAGLITDGTWNADTIGATYGGTAQTTYATGDMLYASGANTLAKRTIGTTGQVLQVVGGVPVWVATSSLGFVASGSAITDIGPAGQLQSGPVITQATSTGSFNGLTTRLTITGSANTLTYTPTITGTLNNAGITTPYLSFATTSTGTDISWSTASTTLGSTATLNIPSSSATNRGLLTSADWTTFNGKISSTSLDTIAELDTLITDVAGVTGTGGFVLSVAPTLVNPAFSGSTFTALTPNRLMVVGASGISTTTITLANVINTISDVSGSTGTGNLALSASPTFTGTANFANLITTNATTTALAVSSLTSGRVPFASTGGRLIDDANFTFDGSRLSTLNLNVTGTSTFLGTTTMATTSIAGTLQMGTTSIASRFNLDVNNFSTTGTAGLNRYYTSTNSASGTVQFGELAYNRLNTTGTTTYVGSMFRVEDSTTRGNTVRGLEVQTNRGTNTQGENTALSGFARTFGVRGFTSADAGGVFEPAGGYFETGGTTQGNAIRGYSASITTASLASLFQDTSTFSGTGLQMNLGNGSGSFTGKFIDLQVAGVSKFSVASTGAALLLGNLNINSTNTNPAGNNVVGMYFGTNGHASINRSAGVAMNLGRSDDGAVLQFYSAGAVQGSVSIAGATVSYNAFTGSHFGLTGSTTYPMGTLMQLSGDNQSYNNDPASEILYGMEETTTENSSTVIGSYLSVLEPALPESVANPTLVMAVGNGAMWIADQGEDITRGDYLISSNVAGHAELDPQTDSNSNIIARASEDIHWDDVTAEINGVKHKRITVFFENFVRPNIDLALIASSTVELEDIESASQTGQFIAGLFAKLITWFGSAQNGIEDMYANVFNANERICVDGECLTADDIRDLKDALQGGGSNNPPASNGGGGDQGGGTGNGEGDTGGDEPPPGDGGYGGGDAGGGDGGSGGGDEPPPDGGGDGGGGEEPPPNDGGDEGSTGNEGGDGGSTEGEGTSSEESGGGGEAGLTE